ncbi:MAG: ABC transporter ATP-binding protein [Bacillota bacterium]|nr:ABC transporter ATP-binding protein [Bacillota bacterium]
MDAFILQAIKYMDILDIAELKIPLQKVTCLLGESGSGKTTLLRLLNHLISPDSGKIYFMGEDLSELNPVELRRRVVMLPQTPVVFPGSVEENLLQGLVYSEKPQVPPEKLTMVMEKVKLSKELHTPAGVLSGGEKQRLALARILLMDPDVFLLDEPSSALDELTEKLILDSLTEYARSQGKTLIMVTHNRRMGDFYADYTVFLEKGHIQKTAEVAACE